MSKDIHKWTDGRYTLMFDEHTFFVWDNVKEERMTALNVTKKLNEQQDKITELEVEWTDCKNRKEQSEYNLQKRIDEQQTIINKLQEENASLEQRIRDIKYNNCD